MQCLGERLISHHTVGPLQAVFGRMLHAIQREHSVITSNSLLSLPSMDVKATELVAIAMSCGNEFHRLILHND